MTVRNKVTIGNNPECGTRVGDLENGTMFRSECPARDDTVYMKIGISDNRVQGGYGIRCILLCSGVDYTYDPEKRVAPIRRGQSVTITQGG